MKKIAATVSLVLICLAIYAQSKPEEEINKLEQLEVEAILKKDTLTLLKLWDKAYIVNSPENVIVLPGSTVVDRPVMNRARTSFTRQTEKVTIRGDVAFAMGSETVVPADNTSQPGKTIKRRYTNVWMKENNEWKLVARHANIICP